MFQEAWSTISWALGLELESKELTVRHMSLRAVVVFIASIVMIRLGDKRFMGRVPL